MNKTRFKSLDAMARDPRVIEIWDEEDDGIWAQLAPGYNFDGSSCLHEWTVRALIKAWRTKITSDNESGQSDVSTGSPGTPLT